MAASTFLLLFCFVSIVFGQHIPDQCVNHQTFTNDPRRSTTYHTDYNSGNLFCDNGVTPGWYRILPIDGAERSADIVWTAPDAPYRCGTEYPAYLQANSDPYPARKYETVTVGLCVMYATFAPCLTGGNNVEITNCGTFNVYKLSFIPFLCSTGYCFSNTAPCRPGTYSETGFEPCAGNIPMYEGQPVVEYLVENNQLVFKCNTAGVTRDSGHEVTRRVRWYFERAEDIGGVEHLVHEETNPHSRHSYKLFERHWVNTFSLGVKIRCSVTGMNSDFQPGRTVYSEKFFAGLKAMIPDTGVLIKADGKPFSVEIKPTVPILCPIPQAGPSCSTTLKLKLLTRDTKMTFCESGYIGDTSNILLDETQCGTEISAELHHNIRLTGANITFLGRLATAYEGDGQTALSIRVDQDELDGQLSHWYQKLPDIPVKVVNDNVLVAGKICMAYNDPHMRTFDGSNYEMHVPGTYIMYKHERQPVQVQARFEPCHPPGMAPTCICAIAVQSGKDIFMYDHCKKTFVNREIQYLRVGVLGCENKAMYITRKPDGTHKIVLPTGTIVEVSGIRQGDSPSLNQINRINIYPSPFDWGLHAVGGLCGVLTGLPSNDFKIRTTNVITQDKDEFAASWKVDDAFEDLLKKPQDVAGRAEYDLPTQCTCELVGPQDQALPRTQAVCDRGQATRCKIKDEATLLRICQDSGRSKRQILMDNDLDIFADPFEFIEYVVPTLPPVYDDADQSSIVHQSIILDQEPVLLNGWTLETARNRCRNFLRNNLPQECREALGSEISQMTDTCVIDIQLTGTDDYLLSNLQGLFSFCENVVTKNNTFWVTSGRRDSNGNPVFEPPTAILQKLCPAACNQRGLCVNGSCRCNNGFSGEDCGYMTSLVPTNLMLLHNGLCDVNRSSCEATIIYGNDFSPEEGALKCKLHEFVLNNPLDLSAKTFTRNFTVPAEVMSISQAKCDLEPAAARKKRQAELGHEDHVAFGFEISMSNDGRRFSAEETMIVYDSRCFTYHPVTKAGQLKVDVCVINGLCLEAGDRNPDDASQICLPARSQTIWSVAPR